MRKSDQFRPKTDHAANPDTGEIQAILARRKRLLTELFFLSKYIDVSQTYDNIDGAARARVDSEDLAVFLAENDLSRCVNNNNLRARELTRT